MKVSKSTRQWYLTNIMNILEKHGKANVRVISMELTKLGGKKYSANEGRITNYLRQLRKMGYVDYCRKNTKHRIRLKLPSHEGVWMFKKKWNEGGELDGKTRTLGQST